MLLCVIKNNRKVTFLYPLVFWISQRGIRGSVGAGSVVQSRLTLFYPKDWSQPGSSVQGFSPGKNTGVGCHSFLQGIFPTQGSDLSLPLWGQILHHPNHQGKPVLKKGMCYFLTPNLETMRLKAPLAIPRKLFWGLGESENSTNERKRREGLVTVITNFVGRSKCWLSAFPLNTWVSWLPGNVWGSHGIKELSPSWGTVHSRFK